MPLGYFRTKAQALKQFTHLIDSIGIWVVYTRSDPRFVCRKCWNPDKRDADPACGTCFGTGFQVELQKWKVYLSNILRKTTPLESDITDVGFSNEQSIFVFSKAVDAPVINDRYFLVEWDEAESNIAKFGQPLRLLNIYRVTFIQPMLVDGVSHYISHTDSQREVINKVEPVLMKTGVARRD